MKLPAAFAWMELPLLRRELLEDAQRKRTYVVRVLTAFVLMLILLTFYMDQIAGRRDVRQILGRGGDLALVLLITDLFAVYLLLPALACSAISAEREKQTLSLLLVSRISPAALIIEKFLSRLMPMIVILLLTAPMLGISYVFGGISPKVIGLILMIVLVAAIQVTSAAVFFSAVFRTTLEAFWATYILLVLMAFGPPILNHYVPMPQITLVSGMPSGQQQVLFILFLFFSRYVEDGGGSLRDFMIAAVPPLTVAAGLLILSGVVLGRWKEASLLSTQVLTSFVRRAASSVWKLPRTILGRRSAIALEKKHEDSGRPVRSLPDLRPIAWREVQNTFAAGWQFPAYFCGAVLLAEWWMAGEVSHRSNRQDLCILIDITVLVLALLIVMGAACRSFASERERQTLDSLLTLPIDNRELLTDKLAAARRVRTLMLPVILLAGFCRVFLVDYDGNAFRSPSQVIYYPISLFLWSDIRYLYGLLAHSYVYLTIVLWTAAYFSLRLNSMMKAMMATLLSVIGLCVVPFLCILMPAMLLRYSGGGPPDRWIAFTTPIMVLMMNEYGEIEQFFRDFAPLNSELAALQLNLIIYGMVALGVRRYVRSHLPQLLNRR